MCVGSARERGVCEVGSGGKPPIADICGREFKARMHGRADAYLGTALFMLAIDTDLA